MSRQPVTLSPPRSPQAAPLRLTNPVRIRFGHVLFMLTVLALSMGACAGVLTQEPDKTEAQDTDTSQLLDPTVDNTLTSDDGTVTLILPAGALTQPTAITITTLDPGDVHADLAGAVEIVAAAWRMEPDGLVFAFPVTATFRFSVPEASTLPMTEATLVWGVYSSSGNNDVLANSAGLVQTATGGVSEASAAIEHFTDFAVVLAGQLQINPTCTTCTVGALVGYNVEFVGAIANAYGRQRWTSTADETIVGLVAPEDGVHFDAEVLGRSLAADGMSPEVNLMDGESHLGFGQFRCLEAGSGTLSSSLQYNRLLDDGTDGLTAKKPITCVAASAVTGSGTLDYGQLTTAPGENVVDLMLTPEEASDFGARITVLDTSQDSYTLAANELQSYGNNGAFDVELTDSNLAITKFCQEFNDSCGENDCILLQCKNNQGEIIASSGSTSGYGLEKVCVEAPSGQTCAKIEVRAEGPAIFKNNPELEWKTIP